MWYWLVWVKMDADWTFFGGYPIASGVNGRLHHMAACCGYDSQSELYWSGTDMEGQCDAA